MAGWYLMPHNYHLALPFWCVCLPANCRHHSEKLLLPPQGYYWNRCRGRNYPIPYSLYCCHDLTHQRLPSILLHSPYIGSGAQFWGNGRFGMNCHRAYLLTSWNCCTTSLLICHKYPPPCNDLSHLKHSGKAMQHSSKPQHLGVAAAQLCQQVCHCNSLEHQKNNHKDVD